METLCDTYLNALQWAAEGAHIISTDEKTGMQALERLHETKSVRPGLVKRVEFEYSRHGTLVGDTLPPDDRSALPRSVLR